jgi:hypothetical protein
MARAKKWILPVLFLISVVCQTVSAQATKTITLRILDGKTGQRITPTGFLVRIDHQSSVHNEWVRPNEDGTAQLSLPNEASVVMIHATYDSSTEIYLNCDGVKRYQTASPLWYSVSEIAAKGLVAQNGCIDQNHEDKLKTTANPGEFVLYVREDWMREATH